MTGRRKSLIKRVGDMGGLAAGAVLVWFLVVMVLPALPAMLQTPWRLRAPDWPLLLSQPPAILVHITAALAALALGLAQFLGRKGVWLHRVLGWAWVAAMAVAAVSSIFIRQINDGAFSFIHILTGLTLIALPMGVHAARRHEVEKHRKEMQGLFVGALIVAGLLALLPGRLIWRVFFS